jgi:predicted transcriptional regulator
MKKLLIGCACIAALATSCKEKSANEKIQDGLEEAAEGLNEKTEETGKKASNLFKAAKKSVEDATDGE